MPNRNYQQEVDGTEPAYARVICPHHGGVMLTYKEYSRQLDMPGYEWRCAYCGAESDFDDNWFDEVHNKYSDEKDNLPD